MWRVVREKLAQRNLSAADDAEDEKGCDFDDMMNVYDEELDADLEKFVGDRPARTRDAQRIRTYSDVSGDTPFVSRTPYDAPHYAETITTRKPKATRICAYCLRPDCHGECVDDQSVPRRVGTINRVQPDVPFMDSTPGATPPPDRRPSPPPGSPSRVSQGEDGYYDFSTGSPRPQDHSVDLQGSSRPEMLFSRTHAAGEMASPQIDFGSAYEYKGVISPTRQPQKFFKQLVRAIKADNLKAVKSMCRAVQEQGVDLSDTKKYSENIYTATALHVALLFKRPNMAEELILTCPKLVSIAYKSKHLRNQTAFHIAAANGDLRTMKLMLQTLGTPEDIRKAIDNRATGTYFEKAHPEGALCLTASIWAGHTEMFKLLLANGANMEKPGPCGNTPLHHIVFLSDEHPLKQAKIERYFELIWDYCDSWWAIREAGFVVEDLCPQKATKTKVEAMRYLLHLRNDDQQTPLTLAVNLQAPIAKFLLNFEPVYRLPQTKFGSTAWVTYDVTEVTSYVPATQSSIRYNPSSVLHILAHRAKIVSTDDQTFTDLIETQPIIDLVKMKWSVYKWVYYAWMALHLGYIITLTWYGTHPHYYQEYSSEVHNMDNSTPAATSNTSYFNINATIDHPPGGSKSHTPWLFFILPLIYLIMEIEDLVFISYGSVKSLKTSRGFRKTMRFWAEQWTVTGNGPFRATLIAFSLSILAWAIMYELDDMNQDMPLSLALILGWIFMIFFTRAFPSTSRFSIMVQKMFFQDFLYFLSVYSFIWLAFASAMQAIVHHNQRKYINIGDTLYSMLNIVTDAGEKATEHTARMPKIAAIMLSCYAVISVILLLNMLIAMMNASYDAVKMSKTNLFRYQQLSILLMIERRLFWFEKLCVASQKHLWCPKIPIKDELDGRKTQPTPSPPLDDVEMKPIMKKKRLTLPPTRIYVEVTERSFTDCDNIYSPYQ